MRVAIISSRYPRANSEPFLESEADVLAPRLEFLTVLPLRPPFARGTLSLAATTFMRSPRAALSALWLLLRGSGGAAVRAKNLAIFPRALALAEIARRHGVQHVHAYWLSAPATAALVVARLNGITWSASAHRWDIFERNMIPEKAASASFIRTISERGRAELVRRAPQHAQKFVVVRLGTALTSTALHCASRERRELRILCAAAFRQVKGHAVLIDAFASARRDDPRLHLTLCGDGPLQMEMRARARELPDGSVTFRGYVHHAHLLREMAAGAYDAVVLSSLDDGDAIMEGVPSILIEAASMGIACIATRSGAVTELLDDESAFLANANDASDLARAMIAATNASERGRRGTRARARALALHHPGERAAELAELFGESA